MKSSKHLIDKLTPLISETMGDTAGEVFYKFYELEDDDEVLTGAQGLLYEMMGHKRAEQKLKEVMQK